MKNFLFFIATLLCVSSGIKVLLFVDSVNNGYYVQPTIAHLMSVSYIENVTTFTTNLDTPTLEFMTEYDCVLIIGSYYGWHDSDALGDVLVKYMATRGGVVTSLDYYYFQNDVIGGAFAPYNYFMQWYPDYDPTYMIVSPNNTNTYSFNTSNLMTKYHLSLTKDQMLSDMQILFQYDTGDDNPYIAVSTATINLGGMPSVRTDLNFHVYAPELYSYGWGTNDTLLLITDALLRASRPCVTECYQSINVTADDECMANYPPFACDSVVQLTTGSVTGVGAYTLRLEISGSACNTTMNVVDQTPPVLLCPSGFHLTAEHCNVTLPEITGVNVTDNCDYSDFELTQSPPAGSVLGIGSHTITMSATDMYGNVGTCTVEITVNSSRAYTEPPTLYCPTEYYASFSQWDCYGLVENYDGSINATDECGVLIPYWNMYQEPYPEYPVINGSIIITIYATDDYNNTNSCQFAQISVDTSPPEGYCGVTGVRFSPILELDEECKAPVGDIPAFFYDNCYDGEMPYQQSPNGTEYIYGPGAFNVTTWAVDDSGNIGYCYVEMDAIDWIAPVLSCPDIVTVNSVIVPDMSTYVNASDNCGDLFYNQTVAMGTIVTLGNYDMKITVWDVSGNYQDCNVTVIFQPPDVICPSAYTFVANSSCGAQVPVITMDPYFSITQYPAGNTTISTGVTSLNVTVTDPANKTTICVTTVTVTDQTPPQLSCEEKITVLNVTENAEVPDISNFITFSDSCGSASFVQYPARGDLVAIGNHTINVTVTDLSGNTAKCVISLFVEKSGGESPIITPSHSSSSSGGGIGPGAIAGIVIGVLVGLCLIIGLIVALIIWRRREKKEDAFFSIELVPSGGGPKSTGLFKAKN